VSADLVAFLRARIDEDEAVARAATVETGGPRWHGSDSGLCSDDASNHPGPFLVDAYGYTAPELVAHIARHDPARVLADIAAKRAIVDRMAAVLERGWDYYENSTVIDLAEATLRNLAAPYAGADGYRPEWAPDA
jgi:hypothetical protein